MPYKDPEKKKAYMKDWQAKHKTQTRKPKTEPEPEPTDNIAEPELVPAQPEEFEIDYAEYKRFKEWQKLNEDLKKKGTDPSYIIPILKSLGVALVPALIGAVQRAAIKTVEQSQNPEQTRSPPSTDPSNVTGSGQWDPLSQPKL